MSWRLLDQEEYLKEKKLLKIDILKYKQKIKNPLFFHEHCEFCFDNIEKLEEGYCSRDFYRWICPTCYRDFLKEFAFEADGIENACMEFDSNTLQPLYAMHIGLPGSSNALAISRRLGLKESILNDALASLSEDGQKFERIVRSAEESRIRAEETFAQSNRLRLEWQEKLPLLEIEREKLKKEKEKLFTSAKAESRRIINERSAAAEELLHEIEEIFAKESISEADLIKARTLKNKLSDAAYESENEEGERQYIQLNIAA